MGCGWGFLLIEAAKKYKIKGTGISLKPGTVQRMSGAYSKEGLEDYLTVKLMDYRDLPKSRLTFDRVVSVGMAEHVGRENFVVFARIASTRS